MKKYLVFVFVLLSLYSCNKNITSDMPNVPSDSLMLTVMQSIMDTNRSYLDVKEELFMFIDTMQSHAEFHPDPEIRVGAKSFADLLAQLLLAPEFNTPEEMRFTIDSVIEPIRGIFYSSHKSLAVAIDFTHARNRYIFTFLAVYIAGVSPSGQLFGINVPHVLALGVILAARRAEQRGV
jgi:hypothetical protein